jgi:tRNA(His) 5'-end guanylyltransferase
MVAVTTELVDHFQAKVGYTQSDEITLAWYSAPHETTEYPFSGRFQKLESLMAAYATAVFNRLLGIHIPEKEGKLAIFDARAFVVPNIKEAYHAFLWRQQDATKNAISMAAQSMFSHKSLQGLHGPEMQEKMFAEKGVNFNDYPFFFKRGTFVKRFTVTRPIESADFERVPPEFWESFRAKREITRTEIKPMDVWLSKEEDPVDILFGDGRPILTEVLARAEKLKW